MKLAINGGNKTLNPGKHYTWPIITSKTKKAVLKQMDDSISIYNRSGIFKKFEDRFKKFHNKSYGLLNNSGTTSILSMYIGSNLKKNDEVICPAYTFYATVTPLFFTGAKPVLADAGLNGNIDPKDIENKITDKTKAIVLTHMWGIPCDMNKINSIAEKYNLKVFEDCSHAHGAVYNDKPVGSISDVAVFSLQGQKTLTGGEGGILITNDKDLYERANLLGHYNKRCKEEIDEKSPIYKYAVTGMGLKFRAHPLAIAIVNEQFDNLEKILNGKRKNAKKLLYELSNLPGITVPSISNKIDPSWYAFVFQYDENKTGIPINIFYNALKAEGCSELDRPSSTCPLNFHPLFQNPTELFSEYKLDYKKGDFPNAEKFYKQAIKMPVWHDNNGFTEKYISAIRKVSENLNELRRKK